MPVKMDLDSAARQFAVGYMAERGVHSGVRGEEEFAEDTVDLYAGVRELIDHAWRDGHRYTGMTMVTDAERAALSYLVRVHWSSDHLEGPVHEAGIVSLSGKVGMEPPITIAGRSEEAA